MSDSNQRTLLYIWKQRSLYMGSPFNGSGVSYGSPALIANLDGSSLSIQQEGISQPLKAQIALIPAGLQLKLNGSNGNVACFFLDPFGQDYSLLMRCMRSQTGSISHDAICDESFLSAFRTIWFGQFTSERAAELIAEAFPDPRALGFRHKVDEKVVSVIKLITQDPSENLCNDHLAAHVGISEVQLRRVFKCAVGVPIRRYRLWHRLFVAMRLMADGRSLTDSAIESGFSDSSHFNHVFRDVFGVNPSSVLKRNGIMRVFVSDEFSADEKSVRSSRHVMTVPQHKNIAMLKYGTQRIGL